MVLRWLKQTADENCHISCRGVNPQMQLTPWIHKDLHPLNTHPALE